MSIDSVVSATTCTWCGLPALGSENSCRACGASLDVPVTVTRSGWTKLPGRHDMAKIQFGKSSCQIAGNYVPVADMQLAAGDSVYFGHHVLLWMDGQVKVSGMSMKGAWKRMLSGMPLIMTQAEGPGRIAFSRDAPGELIALPLQPGEPVDVREHLFLVATKQVCYDWMDANIWFTTQEGNEEETHYPVGPLMDRFVAPAEPGLLILHAAGNVFERTLAPGQSILVKPTALLFKDPSVSMHLHFEHPAGTWRSWRSWGDRYLWLKLNGPGRVAVQSAFEPVEDNGRTIVRHSQASRRQW